MIKHHDDLMSGVTNQLSDILDKSEQAIYIYLDDVHKVCNTNFADLLGYRTPDEWAMVGEDFPMIFVAEKSRETLVNAYRNAVERFIGSTIKVTWNKKSGGTVDTTVILVPIIFEGHTFALHFIN
jgi:hypothetical protein